MSTQRIVDEEIMMVRMMVMSVRLTTSSGNSIVQTLQHRQTEHNKLEGDNTVSEHLCFRLIFHGANNDWPISN